jgi:hypothetical protein
MAATMLGALGVYFTDVISTLGALLPPVLFSLALVLSNRPYLQSDAAYVYMPFAFFLIYFLGYGTVLWLASLFLEDSLYQNILATLVTWTAIWLITWGALNDLKVSYRQPLLIVVLAIAGNLLIEYFKLHFSSSDSRIFNPAGESLFLNVLITQVSLTVIILSMMTKGDEVNRVPLRDEEHKAAV